MYSVSPIIARHVLGSTAVWGERVTAENSIDNTTSGPSASLDTTDSAFTTRDSVAWTSTHRSVTGTGRLYSVDSFNYIKTPEVDENLQLYDDDQFTVATVRQVSDTHCVKPFQVVPVIT